MPRTHFVVALVLFAASTLLASSTAFAAWPHQSGVNLAVCTAALSNPQYLSSTPDGSGGAIVVWWDQRGTGGIYDIYAQHLTAAGGVDPAWPVNGRAICTAADYQTNPVAVSDGSGGAIVAWNDFRNAGSGDIYAQHVFASGLVDPMWPTDGRAICNAAIEQHGVVIASDGAGGAVMAWEDRRTGAFDIYAQHVKSTGVVDAAWPVDGRAVCTAAGDQNFPVIASDAAGGAIVTWQDSRTGGTIDIYAQRVLASGSVDPNWAFNGLAVCVAAGAQQFPAIVADGAGGAVITWLDSRFGNPDVYAQHVMNAGNVDSFWPADGRALCSASGSQETPMICGDGTGGAIVAWGDRRTPANPDIYAQHVSATGVVDAAWPADGRTVCTAAATQAQPAIVSDGNAGAFITWTDNRNGDTNTDIFAGHVLSTGAMDPVWASNGVALSTATSNQQTPSIVGDGTGGAIVGFVDLRAGVFGLYAQRVARYGVLGTPEPVIASVKDVPNDQGGKLKLSWDASWLDTDPSPSVDHYWILRSVPASAAAVAIQHGVAVRLVSAAARAQSADPLDATSGWRATPYLFATQSATGTIYWEFVTSVQALHIVSGYSYVAGTSGDSTGANNTATQFMVTAWNAGGTQYWSSSPLGGYSVDNLPPYTPLNLIGNFAPSATHLHWGPNTDADFANYRIYRGASANFVPGPGNLLATPPDTGYADGGVAGYYYKLSAVDAHGNESGFALLTPAGTLEVSGATNVLALAAPVPNPSAEGVMLRLTLPATQGVDLAIHDAAGRRVRQVLAGVHGPGEHTIRWDGRDDAGHALPPGMYFLRLETAGHVMSRRIVRVE